MSRLKRTYGSTFVALIVCATLQLGCTGGNLGLSGKPEFDPAEAGDPTEPATALPEQTPSVGPNGELGNVSPTQNPPAEFVALPSTQAGSKVKSLLTGLALTDSEFVALDKDGSNLEDMVDAWMQSPQWRKVMTDYFRSVFQQGTYNMYDYANDYVNIFQINQDWDWFGWHTWTDIITGLRDMFPRTVMQLIDENRPFTEVLTTRRYMLNVPMMVMLSYLDSVPRDSDYRVVKSGYWFSSAYPNAKYTRQATRVIPFADSMNPNSPDFMTWYDPSYEPNNNFNPTWCKEPIVFDANGYSASLGYSMGFQYAADMAMSTIFGGRARCAPWSMAGHSPGRAGVFSDADWNTWKMVTIRHPVANEQPTLFMNVPRMRQSNELVLYSDVAGFMTTPAFFVRWRANKSNAERVLVNQALMIGLDYTFAPAAAATGSSATPEVTNPNMHAQPGTACFGCHSQLDPTVTLFRNSYDLSHKRQLNLSYQPAVPAQGSFNVPGAPPTVGSGVGTLAQAMASHPLFATSWVQKMCRFANSADCDTTDPEFIRVAQTFAASNYNFKVLLRTLLTSPLVTYAKVTQSTARRGSAPSILRQEQLCAQLEARLQWPDVCQLASHDLYEGTADADTDAYGRGLRALASAVAPTEFIRGQISPAMPTDPDLFFVEGIEHLCSQLATQMVDRKVVVSTGISYPSGLQWSSGDPNAAIKDFVATLMGVPAADPRHGELLALLQQHYAAALKAGATASNATRSTFAAACHSAATVSRGI